MPSNHHWHDKTQMTSVQNHTHNILSQRSDQKWHSLLAFGEQWFRPAAFRHAVENYGLWTRASSRTMTLATHTRTALPIRPSRGLTTTVKRAAPPQGAIPCWLAGWLAGWLLTSKQHARARARPHAIHEELIKTAPAPTNTRERDDHRRCT